MLRLPQYLFNWDDLNFKEEYALCNAFFYNQFRTKFKDWRRQRLLDTTSDFFSSVRERLKEAHTIEDHEELRWICHLLYDNCCQVYTKFILKVLRTELDLHLLTKEERRGYHGLNLSLLKKALNGEEPVISFPRGVNRNRQGTGEKGISVLATTWPQRLSFLFDWRHPVTPTWENVPFRRTARACHKILCECWSETAGEAWLNTIGDYCGRRLNCIPLFEATKLHRTQKASPANSLEVQSHRRAGGKSTIWMMAY